MVLQTSDASGSAFIGGRAAIRVRSYVWFTRGLKKSRIDCSCTMQTPQQTRESQYEFAFNGGLSVKTCGDGRLERVVVQQ